VLPEGVTNPEGITANRRNAILIRLDVTVPSKHSAVQPYGKLACAARLPVGGCIVESRPAAHSKFTSLARATISGVARPIQRFSALRALRRSCRIRAAPDPELRGENPDLSSGYSVTFGDNASVPNISGIRTAGDPLHFRLLPRRDLSRSPNVAGWQPSRPRKVDESLPQDGLRPGRLPSYSGQQSSRSRERDQCSTWRNTAATTRVLSVGPGKPGHKP